MKGASAPSARGTRAFNPERISGQKKSGAFSGEHRDGVLEVVDDGLKEFRAERPVDHPVID